MRRSAFRILVVTPGSTWVPTPSSVKISSSTACGTRPSMTVARGDAALRRPAGRRSIFGHHARWPGVGSSSASASGRDLADHVVAVGPVAVEALDVGEHEQLLGAQRDGQRGGGGVGVDVVDRGRRRRARRWRRPGSGRPRRGRATASGRTSATSPTRPRSTSSPSTTVLVRLGGEQAGVLAGEPDRERAVLVDQADELALDLADQHHPDDVHRLGRGDPQAARNSDSMPSRSSIARDLRAAAVHDDRLEAGVAQEGDVLGEGPLEGVVGHRVAAVLHHDDLAVVALQPGQRLGEGGGLGGVGGGVLVVRSSVMRSTRCSRGRRRAVRSLVQTVAALGRRP